MAAFSVLGAGARSPAGTKLVEEGELRTLLMRLSTDASPAWRTHTQLEMQIQMPGMPVCGCIRGHPVMRLLRALGWPQTHAVMHAHCVSCGDSESNHDHRVGRCKTDALSGDSCQYTTSRN